MSIGSFFQMAGFHIGLMGIFCVPITIVLCRIQRWIVEKNRKDGIYLPIITVSATILWVLALGFFAMGVGMNIFISLLTFLLALVVANIPTFFLLKIYKESKSEEN